MNVERIRCFVKNTIHILYFSYNLLLGISAIVFMKLFFIHCILCTYVNVSLLTSLRKLCLMLSASFEKYPLLFFTALFSEQFAVETQAKYWLYRQLCTSQRCILGVGAIMDGPLEIVSIVKPEIQRLFSASFQPHFLNSFIFNTSNCGRFIFYPIFSFIWCISSL